MHPIRTISDEERRSLKGMTAACLKFIGVSAFQHMTRVKVPALSKYGSAGEEHQQDFMPVDIAIEADRAAGEPVIVAEMARLLGYRLVKDDEQERAGLTPSMLLSAAGQFGRTIEAASKALDDGRVDAAERAQLTPMLIELNRQTGDMLARVAGGA